MKLSEKTRAHSAFPSHVQSERRMPFKEIALLVKEYFQQTSEATRASSSPVEVEIVEQKKDGILLKLFESMLLFMPEKFAAGISRAALRDMASQEP